ncbi:MAG: hypothetical protein MUC35_05245 [Candidatus Margulisbacteria bacterium]|jgi:hypothetical protein|nr:hypothetical protein [Candidatus Margulisiibacteriota bacterium]
MNGLEALNRSVTRANAAIGQVAAGEGGGKQFAAERKAQKSVDELLALASTLLAQRKINQIVDTII